MVQDSEWRPTAVWRIGRPRLRQEDDVYGDLGRIKFHFWSEMAMDREAGKKTVDQAKTHTVVAPSAEKKMLR